MTQCKTAAVMNGRVKVGDKVINVPTGHGDRAFYGIVKEIVRYGNGCTWVVADTNIGRVKYPASLLRKGMNDRDRRN